MPQVRRAVTEANARAPLPEMSQAERREQAERERESKRDRSSRKRPADDGQRRALEVERDIQSSFVAKVVAKAAQHACTPRSQIASAGGGLSCHFIRGLGGGGEVVGVDVSRNEMMSGRAWAAVTLSRSQAVRVFGL